MPLTRRQIVLQGAALAIGATRLPAALAQSAVKIYVGFPPAGLPDLVARAVAEQFNRSLGVTAVVENRAGANGRLAGQAVKNSPADGSAFLCTPESGIVHLPHVYNNLGFDPMTDFVPVAQMVENDFALAISAKIPATTLKEFAQWCKANPDKAVFASPGQGSSPHLMGMLMAHDLGIKMMHVPYKGSTFALNDLMGGQITSMVSSTSFVLQPHKAGSVRILATTGRARSPALPNVPTFKELGMDDLLITEGTWLMAPARTPGAIVEKFAAAALAAVKSREMANVLDGQTVAAPLGPQALAVRMKEDYEKRGKQVKETGFSATA